MRAAVSSPSEMEARKEPCTELPAQSTAHGSGSKTMKAVSIYNRGGKSYYEHHGRISLIRIVYKLLASIILRGWVDQPILSPYLSTNSMSGKFISPLQSLNVNGRR